MPIFALANSGVAFEGSLSETLTNPVALGTVLGLVVGKQIGVTLFSWFAVCSGLATLPSGINWW